MSALLAQSEQKSTCSFIISTANIYDSNRLAHQYDVHVVHVIKQLLGQRINRLMISACDLAIARKNRCIHLLDVGRHASYM